MLPTLQIGPLSLPTAAFLLLIGLWLALEVTEKHAPIFKIAPPEIYNLVLVSVGVGILAARLSYAAQSPGVFLEKPLSLLALTPQMLDPLGGLLSAALAALVYIRITRLPLWTVLDTLTTLFSIFAVVLGLAHFASGDAFGAPASLPWAIYLWGELRHPSQVYETLAALGAAFLVWPESLTARRSQSHPGFRFWVFVAVSAAARLVLETFRGDSLLLAGTFRTAQVLAWAALALSLWQIGRRLADPPAPHMLEEDSLGAGG